MAPEGALNYSYETSSPVIYEIEKFEEFAREYLIQDSFGNAAIQSTTFSAREHARLSQLAASAGNNQLSGSSQRLPIVGDHSAKNQDVKNNLNGEEEQITRVFLLRGKGFDAYSAQKWALVTPYCKPCYIFEDSLAELGLTYLPAEVKRTFNPRGGRFQPLGLTTLYLQFGGLELWVKFVSHTLCCIVSASGLTVSAHSALVLPGDSSQIGGPELILGWKFLEWFKENSPGPFSM